MVGVIHCVGERERECEKERAEDEAEEASEEGGGAERRVVVVCETGDVVEESEESEEDESKEDEVKETTPTTSPPTSPGKKITAKPSVSVKSPAGKTAPGPPTPLVKKVR